MQGYITGIKEKDTKFGKMYDIVIDGTTYGAGKFPPKGYAAGDYVSFEATQKGQYWNLTPGSLSKTNAPAGVAAPPKMEASRITRDKQDVISRQSALNSALQHVSNLIAAGAIPAGAAAKGPKMADKIDAITASYVEKFYEQSTGDKLDLNIDAGAADAQEAGFDE